MVYSDVINGGLVLPKKEKYARRDFEKLLPEHGATAARFIIICSAMVHYGRKEYHKHYSKFFDDLSRFLRME